MLEIEIDGTKLQVPEGRTVMDAADQANIYIPHFCYHRKLSIAANCRMCLVQIEKAPKPMPACATPVTNGMKVFTHSELAVAAQKGVMEFLLINHPLDCPICDQGGECQLQDLAVGYGSSGSRYEEEKRVVTNKNLGPLIATDMTRCIHCTRCVRFGQEIAGVMELGMIGRSEHAEIITFVGQTVDSELSGNMIDLCPVGALTSKPFRYSARTWELRRSPSVSPHCGLGSNLTVQVKQNRVMRVLPRENEEINECWLSDKERFSYEGLNVASRATRPMIKENGEWKAVHWQTALQFVADGLRKIRDEHGAQEIGALATPHQTLEELFLLQKLMRAIGSGNVDFRLRQSDFDSDGRLLGVPWLGMQLADIKTLDRVLVIGSSLRRDHPLIAHRLRQAAKKGLLINMIHSADDDLLFPLAGKAIVAPSQLTRALATIVKGLAAARQVAVPDDMQSVLAGIEVDAVSRSMVENLVSGKNVAVLLGNFAQHHPQASQLHALALALADALGAKFGFLGEAANSVGGYIAGALPLQSGGLNALQMVAAPRRAYLLLGAEPESDCAQSARTLAALRQAQFVVAMSPYEHGALEYAHALLPIAPFSETSGTFISTEGRVQSFSGVVEPLAETRPAWKVLRVLGNLLGLEDFAYQSSAEVRDAALGAAGVATRLNNGLENFAMSGLNPAPGPIERIAEVSAYHADALVRRAPSLQQTRIAREPTATMNGELFQRLGLRDGDLIELKQGSGTIVLTAARDDRLPPNCLRVPAAHPATIALGEMFGSVSAERIEQAERIAV